ncbi:MAG: recombinase family protein [Lachnospiraceae bacterium]|nr:recombinase family protein [Lachnospiraceae bacterium]
MARKPRLDNAAILDNGRGSVLLQGSGKESRTIYKAALYARLSAEDSGKADGESIENQISLLKLFVKEKGEFSSYELFADNGRSGVTFNRPAFNEMMDKIKQGKLNCIIVKDLSRLGRNYLEAGNYLEQVFPLYKVRFISVLDGYDSIHANAADEGLVIPLKNLVNASYAKDISKKAASAIEVKMKQGAYRHRYVPYGYKKDPGNKGYLIIDPDTACNVRDIFRWYRQGESLGGIAGQLNKKKIPCPARYQYEKGEIKEERHKNSVWTNITIKRILENRVYVGDMVCGKTHSSIEGGYRNKKTDESRWFVTNNTHKAIISREEFSEVAKLREESHIKWEKANGSYGYYKPENLFKGKLRCGKCGMAMKLAKRIKNKGKTNEHRYAVYQCCGYKSKFQKECSKILISKDELDNTVASALQLQLKTFVNTKKIISNINKVSATKSQHEEVYLQIQSKKGRAAKLENMKEGLYEDFKKGILDKSEYLDIRQRHTSELKKLKKEIVQLETFMRSLKKDLKTEGNMAELICELQDMHSMTKDITGQLIERITVYEGKRILIKYTFEDELKKLHDTLEEREGINNA